MEFKQYEEAPRSVSEEVIAKVQGKDVRETADVFLELDVSRVLEP